MSWTRSDDVAHNDGATPQDAIPEHDEGERGPKLRKMRAAFCALGTGQDSKRACT